MKIPVVRVSRKKKNFLESHKQILYRPSLFGQDGWILASFVFCMCKLVSVFKLRKFPLIVSAHPYCAPKFTCTSCIERGPQVLKRNVIGQMAIAIGLLGFNDMGHLVTPTFLFRNRFYLTLSPHCPKMNKKSKWKDEKITRFLSTGHGILPSCGCKARETMAAKCELVL